jgi:hypothetical protein
MGHAGASAGVLQFKWREEGRGNLSGEHEQGGLDAMLKLPYMVMSRL